MKTELYKSRNNISGLDTISEHTYERIFKMYKDGDHYAYNILRTVNIPQNLHEDTFYYTRIDGMVTWPQLSFDHYGTIRLWWLICLTNKIMNPVYLPDPGTIIKVIRPSYIESILEQIELQL